MIRIFFCIATLIFSFSGVHAQMIDPDKMAKSAQAGDGPYDMTSSEVLLIQEQLFERGYKVGRPDGKAGPKTRAAIAAWQEFKKRASTGIITTKEFEFLSKQELPKGWSWVSIAASTDGTYASVWSRPRRGVAEDEAMNTCTSKSSSPEKCIVTSSFSMDEKDFGWVASVHCKGKTQDGTTITDHWLISNAAGADRTDVVNRAFDNAKKDGYSRDLCTLRTVVEARGRHK